MAIRSLLRRLLLSLSGLFLPLLLLCQESQNAVDTVKEDRSSYKNKIGIGTPLMANWENLVVRYRYILGLSYERDLGLISAEVMAAGGADFKFERGHYFLFTLGIEKGVWNIGKVYSLDLGVDLIHSYEYNRIDHLSRRDRTNFLGGGIKFSNEFHLSPKHSLALDLRFELWGKERSCSSYDHLSYGRCHSSTDHIASTLSGPERAELYDGIHLFYRYHF